MMKQIVILSGKGGAGKTILTAALAPLAAGEFDIVLADADVDASNLELMLDPTVREEHPFISGQIAKIDEELCQGCGSCREACRFGAVLCPPPDAPLQTFKIDSTACEGCGACTYSCPLGSIEMEPVQAGKWFRSDTRFGPLFHAHLFAGRENSGKLVMTVRQKAREVAQERGSELLLIDGPPGIGCPVVSALTGADLALLVAEPTVSGEHDLKRIIDTAQHFGIPPAVIINKADLNTSRAQAIESYCHERGATLLGRIPYDRAVDDSIVQRKPLTEFDNVDLSRSIVKIWCRLRDSMLEPGKLRLIQ
jgi:MinD superfamily P-loop ATPase